MVIDPNLVHAALVPVGLVALDALVRAVGAAKKAPERGRTAAALTAAVSAIEDDLGPIGGALATGILGQGSLEGVAADVVSGAVVAAGAAVAAKALADLKAHVADIVA